MPTSNDILRGTSLHVRRQISDLLDAANAATSSTSSSNAYALGIRDAGLAMYGGSAPAPDSTDWILPSQIFGP